MVFHIHNLQALLSRLLTWRGPVAVRATTLRLDTWQHCNINDQNFMNNTQKVSVHQTTLQLSFRLNYRHINRNEMSCNDLF